MQKYTYTQSILQIQINLCEEYLHTHNNIFFTPLPLKEYTSYKMNRQIDRQIDRYRQIERQIDRQIDRQTDRQIDRYTERQIDRQIDRQTDRQVGREIEIDRRIDRQIDRYISNTNLFDRLCKATLICDTVKRVRHLKVVFSNFMTSSNA